VIRRLLFEEADLIDWAYTVNRSAWTALDLLFPPICGGCGEGGSRWCVDCQRNVKILNGTLCEVCGLPLDKAGVCDSCRVDRPHFRVLRAWAVFDNPLQTALHKLKYKRNMSMGDSLAAQMVAFVQELNWPIELIVPIPLGKHRLKERGYNQVAMIARPLALALNLRYAPNVLAHCKETRSQVELTKQERRENVLGAFQAGPQVKGKKYSGIGRCFHNRLNIIVQRSGAVFGRCKRCLCVDRRPRVAPSWFTARVSVCS
jgi:predicted amidophosphoribosyltransferase